MSFEGYGEAKGIKKELYNYNTFLLVYFSDSFYYSLFRFFEK